MKVKLPNGIIKTWTLNKTTLRRLAQVYGNDTKFWKGKAVKLEIVKQSVQGELKDVIYGWPVSEEEKVIKAGPTKVTLELTPEEVEKIKRLLGKK